MKVKSDSEFKPVSLVFETQGELELFFETVEELYWNYKPHDPKRSMLVEISDMLGEYTEDYDKEF